MRENIDVFDFQLGDDEMARIAELDTGSTLSFEHGDPESDVIRQIRSMPESAGAGAGLRAVPTNA